MKRPLNFALLKYYTTVDEACVDDVMDALSDEFSTHRAFKRDKMIESIKTAEKNGLLDETRFDRDAKGNLRIYYSASSEQKDIINSYIK